ncbi:C40 family peptidase [Adhaeribacter pallidiroseus]|uniref:Gamma-D-glutamyl-L-lysine endopeptidase n=1 Tax=Adhaeribacter pallidiroseus TaxID=2072847 RepID=A0A369QGF4_9BACT|nr:C40 family peptidase [Adhaeribacter pallidiroseus]RDC63492.1 Gamma-D-glutamyl-L-lysine endopeptidase [Adhaeribacter pallidiroseus]
MDYGICSLSLVPVRAEPSDKSEIVTQLLYGECYQIQGSQGNWHQIQIAADDYQGWIDFKQHCPVTPDYFIEWKANPHPRAVDLVQTVSSAVTRIPIMIGSVLPFFDGINIRINDQKYVYSGRATNSALPFKINFFTKIANSYLKTPYLWGGKSIFGIDCSGFVQQVFGICGFAFPRDAWQQVSLGTEVHFANLTQPGDLAFFDNAEGRIIHVGIMLENQQIIHAHGEVRVDMLDHYGIFNHQRKRYTHRLRIIKRILPLAK